MMYFGLCGCSHSFELRRVTNYDRTSHLEETDLYKRRRTERTTRMAEELLDTQQLRTTQHNYISLGGGVA